MSPKTHFFTASDGVRLAWHEQGKGQPVVLIHGYISSADMNWIRFGHAAKVAAKGFRVIMPDLRAHGQSEAPHDPALYPPDILTDDNLALIAHLGLTDYDLGGYSLGARTVARMLARDASPRRVIFSGMGLEGLIHTSRRAGHFRHVLTNLGSFRPGTPEGNVQGFIKSTKSDPIALLNILSTFTDTPEPVIRAIEQPVLVLCGEEDDDNGSATALAEALPHGELALVPGGHMSAVVKPELGEALARFLAA
ncbi:alpha/beta fold hydrolase [Sphingomonas sp. MAH-20]|uniref:Alpha/beta fold hydrolase n=1 Tax=Sphingomonas horti TaxID=2682842 RepID=A0A6I4J145_9SPHN|nr:MULTISPECIES: alpha/beta fold hydrolase [Sphingomonas]MBA2919430.1 alpha/beta fold hydrolase [Sphingomonas sp. CGMCC 1.13658]MVO78310.1 alpha/beta fold hydrolase [Sphingomonas horti]